VNSGLILSIVDLQMSCGNDFVHDLFCLPRALPFFLRAKTGWEKKGFGHLVQSRHIWAGSPRGRYGNIAGPKPYMARCDSIGSGKGVR
jgi:hypothetical protein